MTERKSIKPINFKKHFILSLATATLWVPIYNLLCLLRLNKLIENSAGEGNRGGGGGVPQPKNRPVLSFLLMLTFIGAPFVFFKRYQLLHHYINSKGPSRAPPAKKRDKEEGTQNLPLNCIAPQKFVGFVLVGFLLVGVAATGFGLVFHHLFNNPSWSSDAIMILFPVAFAATFIGFGFTVRIIKEENYWVKAFNGMLEK